MLFFQSKTFYLTQKPHTCYYQFDLIRDRIVMNKQQIKRHNINL